MRIEFTPLREELLPACRAVNERLRRHGEPLVVLPEHASGIRRPEPGDIAWTHHVAVDETGAVRGGVLLMEQRGWLAGRGIPLLNVQSPVTEGVIDRAYAGVGLQMLRFIARRGEFAYAVGMGGEQNPFPRFLKAAGWPVSLVPFQFAVMRASRVLCEIGPARRGRLGALARVAAATGLGTAAAAAWRAAHPNPRSRGYSLEAVSSFRPAELEAAWKSCRAAIGFSAARDALAVPALHPESQDRLRRFVLRRAGEAAGWSVALVSEMRENKYFGNLTVGTFLDALAPEEHLPALAARTCDALRDLGCDLAIVNCTHARWQRVFRRLGFLTGPSNYVLALSKPLAAGAGGLDRAYVTRADGDGRLNL